jgi:hypothetical protein
VSRSLSLAEITACLAITCPIKRKYSCTNVSMKRGVRPIAHTRDETVLERIDITILDVARVVGFVTYQVLPEPALPNARSLRAMRTALRVSCFGNALAKRFLINRQRVEKSESPAGRLQTACR